MAARVRLGNPAALIFPVRLTCLNVLYVAGRDTELRRLQIRERGWPSVRFGDDYGIIYRGPDRDAQMAERSAWMWLDDAISLALRDLRGKGLVESRRPPDGWAANFWRISAAGFAWRSEEVALLAASVEADLAALPIAAPAGRDADGLP